VWTLNRPPKHSLPKALSTTVVLFGIAVMLGFARCHVDDPDAGLYTAIARNLAQDGNIFRLSAPSNLWPAFFEHPPFYFGVLAVVLRTFGEAALPFFQAGIGAGTLILTLRLGHRLLGEEAAVYGVLVLILTESFIRYQPRARLDTGLIFFATLSVYLLVTGSGRTSRLMAAGLAAAAGACIKGPAALGAPTMALAFCVCARKEDIPLFRRWWIPTVVSVGLVGLFLVFDHFHLQGTWRRGYVEHQVFASVSGSRADGHSEPFYLFRKVLSRFWPGLPFVILGLIPGLFRDIPDRWRLHLGLFSWALVIIGGYSLAARAYWHYVMPAFIPLSIIAGGGMERLLKSVGSESTRRRIVLGLSACACLLVVVASVSGAWCSTLAKACTFGTLPQTIQRETRPSDLVAVVTTPERRGEAYFLAGHVENPLLVMTSSSGIGELKVAKYRVVSDGEPLLCEKCEELAQHGDWQLLRSGH
jgi:4-amino-4-deoxy-L-arabinose transferase-like glycosyltransferase